jgi:DNA-binding CsgD family transcriptional regulator
MLTPREYQVALMVARGLSNKEIGRELGVSDGTVKLHVHNIFQKLGEKNRYGLIQRMVSSGIAEWPTSRGGQARPDEAPESSTNDRAHEVCDHLREEQDA